MARYSTAEERELTSHARVSVAFPQPLLLRISRSCATNTQPPGPWRVEDVQPVPFSVLINADATPTQESVETSATPVQSPAATAAPHSSKNSIVSSRCAAERTHRCVHCNLFADLHCSASRSSGYHVLSVAKTAQQEIEGGHQRLEARTASCAHQSPVGKPGRPRFPGLLRSTVVCQAFR